MNAFVSVLAMTPAQIGRLWWYITLASGGFSLFCGILWMIWLFRAFRRDLKRDREGLCMKCGYDLRHSVERCPECGEPIGFRKISPYFSPPSRRDAEKKSACDD